MSKSIEKYQDKLSSAYNEIELGENEVKGIVNVTYVMNTLTKEIKAIQFVKGNKVNTTDVLIFIMKDKRKLEIHNIADAVKEFI